MEVVEEAAVAVKVEYFWMTVAATVEAAVVAVAVLVTPPGVEVLVVVHSEFFFSTVPGFNW